MPTTITIPNCTACCAVPSVDACGCLAVPKTLYATVTGKVVHEVEMTWTGPDQWVGTFSCDGCNLSVNLTCTEFGATVGIDFTELACSGCAVTTTASITCSPFMATPSPGFSVSACPCLDTGVAWSLTITE